MAAALDRSAFFTAVRAKPFGGSLTLDRIKAVLGEREKQADFIREAVEAALERRERATARPSKPSPAEG